MLQITIPNLPPRINQKIEALESEKDDAYAADELVELGEEILSQLAAMGIAVYLKQTKQKDVFNDFLISLFLSNGHAYNAGPLYRWAANMIKDAEGAETALLKPFFWQTKDGKEVLNEEIHHLVSLRNAVMHGFFVLPPERNREEAKKMEAILQSMERANLFETSFGSFHFIDQQGFNGHWNISTVESWDLFDQHFSFGKLAERVAHEYAPSFRSEEDQFASESNTPVDTLQAEMQQLLDKGKGALISWYRPGSEMGHHAYRTFVQTLDNNTYFPIYYALHPKGATFTASFLEQELGKGLHRLSSDEKALKDPFKFLKAQKDKLAKKPVIILQDVHLALFSPNHLTSLFNALYDLEVPVLATAKEVLEKITYRPLKIVEYLLLIYDDSESMINQLNIINLRKLITSQCDGDNKHITFTFYKLALYSARKNKIREAFYFLQEIEKFGIKNECYQEISLILKEKIKSKELELLYNAFKDFSIDEKKCIVNSIPMSFYSLENLINMVKFIHTDVNSLKCCYLNYKLNLVINSDNEIDPNLITKINANWAKALKEHRA